MYRRRHSCSVTSSQKTKSNNNYREVNYRTNDNNNTIFILLNKTGCIFCGEQGHVSLFNCSGFKMLV